MQTFVTRSSLVDSPADLDNKRLGKQRVETLQIMSALTGVKFVDGVLTTFQPKGWVNHPAVKMWRGHEMWLNYYQHATVLEWITRGFKDTCEEKTDEIYRYASRYGFLEPAMRDYPYWMDTPDVYMSHQANLLRKDFDYYAPVFGIEDKTAEDFADAEYFWPVS